MVRCGRSRLGSSSWVTQVAKLAVGTRMDRACRLESIRGVVAPHSSYHVSCRGAERGNVSPCRNAAESQHVNVILHPKAPPRSILEVFTVGKYLLRRLDYSRQMKRAL